MTESRTVSFDLMSREPNFYFVLTEALGDFAARERAEAESADDDVPRIRWAETAEEMLDRIEEAVSAECRSTS